MKKLRKNSLRRLVMLVVIMVIAAATYVSVTPTPVKAFDACEAAAKADNRNPVLNFLCWVDIMFDYYFMSGEI
ncbi:MAG: hypothetical protein ABIH38_02330 [Patescibacteria group bacterium]